MHHIYHTHGFIINSKNVGEANKLFMVYTRELGLVHAVAQGVRLHKSKLRFSLQDFSYIKLDLVRGRDIWRITSSSVINSFPILRRNKDSLILISRISKLIERLCGGEESHIEIFDDMIQSFNMMDVEEFNEDTRTALELHLVLRIMNRLGYIGDSDLTSKYLGDFNEDKTTNILKERRSIISYINKALNETQL